MDEPTNHLDEQMILWLEDYLKNYRGTLLMVTHDRYFLDKVTNRILEVSRGKMYGYEANYTKFLELKADREEREMAAQRKRQSILRIELEWAKRGCRARTTKQKARLDRLESLKNGRAPVQEETVRLDSVETRMGKKTIELSHVGKRFGDRVILEDFSYIFLKKPEGGNCGPQRLRKIHLYEDAGGDSCAGYGRDPGGGDHPHRLFFPGRAGDGRESAGDRLRQRDRGVHTHFGRADQRFPASGAVSLYAGHAVLADRKAFGGERRRLYLLGILARNANVLLLDECSDSLDIPTLAVLEDYLNSFQGIVVTVSHDRYFLDNVADRILEFDGRAESASMRAAIPIIWRPGKSGSRRPALPLGKKKRRPRQKTGNRTARRG